MTQLVVVPIVLPLVTAAVLLLLGDRHRRLKSALNVAATLAGLVVASTLLRRADGDGVTGEISVYLAANWEAPYGIVLVADRLSALMLVLVGVVSSCVALYAEAQWSRAGVYFHPIFQIQLMGLNGAFLTGDLFNLFVFFEVMLAASYGLQLHGSGRPRVRSGLHYLAVNLLASSLFLIGLAVIYGIAGTLSMADLAQKLPLVPERDRGLFHAGVAILSAAFFIKAAMWPLNAWLVPAYTATSAPVAALFAVMTKVGFYVLLRLWTLLFSTDTATALHFGRPVLLYGGLATLAFGAMGVLASLRLGRIGAFSLIVSSGTLLAALGIGAVPATAAALFYLLTATLAVSALFLLVELSERLRGGGKPELRDVELANDEDTNLDDEEVPLVGRAFPVSIAVLGLAFIACALVIAGLPPLSGFLAKLSLLTAVLSAERGPEGLPAAAWALGALVLFAGFATTVSLSRAGIRHFWSTGERPDPQLQGLEALAVLALIACCVGLTIWAEPVLRYTKAAAAALHAPSTYCEAVSSMKARPGPVERGAAP